MMIFDAPTSIGWEYESISTLFSLSALSFLFVLFTYFFLLQHNKRERECKENAFFTAQRRRLFCVWMNSFECSFSRLVRTAEKCGQTIRADLSIEISIHEKTNKQPSKAVTISFILLYGKIKSQIAFHFTSAAVNNNGSYVIRSFIRFFLYLYVWRMGILYQRCGNRQGIPSRSRALSTSIFAIFKRDSTRSRRR